MSSDPMPTVQTVHHEPCQQCAGTGLVQSGDPRHSNSAGLAECPNCGGKGFFVVVTEQQG